VKVLFLTSMYHKPGRDYAGATIHRQALELGKLGVEVRVVCPLPRFRRRRGRSDPYSELLRLGTTEVDGVRVTYLPYLNFPLGLSPRVHAALLYRRLARVVGSIRDTFAFDLIHAHRLFPTAYVSSLLARDAAIPLVSSAVGSDVHTHPSRNRGIRTLTQKAIERSDVVVSVSRDLADQVEELAAPARPVRVVYRGVDFAQFVPAEPSREAKVRLGLPPEGVGICTVGRLVREKGVFDLVEAMDLMRDHPRAPWLVMVGEGPARGALESEIQRRGLQDRILLVGAQPHRKVPDWLNAADIFVLASYNEGLPNVVREAMACGRPVVATDVGGVREAVEDGVSGYLLPPRRPELLARALERLLVSDRLRHQLGEEGRHAVRSRFDWAETTKELEAVYQGLLRERPERPERVVKGHR
jgi:teichuronic acid biosynthesis glycosyltransferase TuaC